jgi:predicted DNA-binding transcriptional regulator YafY
MIGRNSELIRQWTILRALTTARRPTIAALAQEAGRSQRTIRRDLEALQAAGFPIEEGQDAAGKYWRLPPRAMAGLARSGFTFPELAALYLSRALFECFAGSTLFSELGTAFDKMNAALSPDMRKFLDRLPKAIGSKSTQTKRQDRETQAIALRLLEAIMGSHVVSMKYYSQSSRQTKAYTVHPYRLVHAQGGLYLVAYVPEYGELRTFAAERMRQAAAEKETFEPIGAPGTDPFANSMGAFRGPVTKVRLRFSAAIASPVQERTWHASQAFRNREDGSVDMTLEVSDDYALRSWILSFGSGVRVMAPSALAEWAARELDTAAALYRGRGALWADDETKQPTLPLYFIPGPLTSLPAAADGSVVGRSSAQARRPANGARTTSRA